MSQIGATNTGTALPATSQGGSTTPVGGMALQQLRLEAPLALEQIPEADLRKIAREAAIYGQLIDESPVTGQSKIAQLDAYLNQPKSRIVADIRKFASEGSYQVAKLASDLISVVENPGYLRLVRFLQTQSPNIRNAYSTAFTELQETGDAGTIIDQMLSPAFQRQANVVKTRLGYDIYSQPSVLRYRPLSLGLDDEQFLTEAAGLKTALNPIIKGDPSDLLMFSEIYHGFNQGHGIAYSPRSWKNSKDPLELRIAQAAEIAQVLSSIATKIDSDSVVDIVQHGGMSAEALKNPIVQGNLLSLSQFNPDGPTASFMNTALRKHYIVEFLTFELSASIAFLAKYPRDDTTSLMGYFGPLGPETEALLGTPGAEQFIDRVLDRWPRLAKSPLDSVLQLAPLVAKQETFFLLNDLLEKRGKTLVPLIDLNEAEATATLLHAINKLDGTKILAYGLHNVSAPGLNTYWLFGKKHSKNIDKELDRQVKAYQNPGAKAIYNAFDKGWGIDLIASSAFAEAAENPKLQAAVLRPELASSYREVRKLSEGWQVGNSKQQTDSPPVVLEDTATLVAGAQIAAAFLNHAETLRPLIAPTNDRSTSDATTLLKAARDIGVDPKLRAAAASEGVDLSHFVHNAAGSSEDFRAELISKDPENKLYARTLAQLRQIPAVSGMFLRQSYESWPSIVGAVEKIVQTPQQIESIAAVHGLGYHFQSGSDLEFAAKITDEQMQLIQSEAFVQQYNRRLASEVPSLAALVASFRRTR